jgi:hypothetical protein
LLSPLIFPSPLISAFPIPPFAENGHGCPVLIMGLLSVSMYCGEVYLAM